jgi:hypothetical protein
VAQGLACDQEIVGADGLANSLKFGAYHTGDARIPVVEEE